MDCGQYINHCGVHLHRNTSQAAARMSYVHAALNYKTERVCSSRSARPPSLSWLRRLAPQPVLAAALGPSVISIYFRVRWGYHLTLKYILISLFLVIQRGKRALLLLATACISSTRNKAHSDLKVASSHEKCSSIFVKKYF